MTPDSRGSRRGSARRGLRNPWLQVAISTVAAAVSELFKKRGADSTIHISGEWGWTGLTTLVSPLVWAGMVFTAVSFATWLYAIRHLPLSVAFPASQAVHVLVPLSSWAVLGEQITPLRWFGVALVVAGLTLVARPVAELEEKI